MSIDPVELVVMPKATAMMFVDAAPHRPSSSCSGIAGALLSSACGSWASTPGPSSRASSSSVFRETTSGAACIKAVVFGALAGLIATFRGYTSTPNAAGVSAATT